MARRNISQMAKVLITSPHGKEPLIQAFEEAGATVVKEMDADVKLIIPTVDEELPFFSRAKQWLSYQGIHVMVSDPGTIDTCRDKAEFYRFCKRHSFATPITGQFEAIVKPRFGKGSKGQFKIDRSYISQEIMDWPEYSVDYLGNWDGKFINCIPRLRLNIINGESHSTVIDNNKQIVNMCKLLGNELKLVGHNTIQLWFDGQHIKFNEVNCRFGGGFRFTKNLLNSIPWLLENL